MPMTGALRMRRSYIRRRGGQVEVVKPKEVIKMSDTMFQLRCPECSREFVVAEEDVDYEILSCPHCQAAVPVDDGEE